MKNHIESRKKPSDPPREGLDQIETRAGIGKNPVEGSTPNPPNPPSTVYPARDLDQFMPQPPDDGMPWTADRVEVWLKAAWDTLCRLRVEGGPGGRGNSWPTVPDDAALAYGYRNTTVPVIPPSPREIDRLDRCWQ